MKILTCLVILASVPAFGDAPPALQEGRDDPKGAKDLLKDALATAKEGKKRVLLTFGSPG